MVTKSSIETNESLFKIELIPGEKMEIDYDRNGSHLATHLNDLSLPLKSKSAGT